MLKLKATLTNGRNGKTTTVRLSPPSVNGGIWIFREAARRAAFKRIGADWEDTNAGVNSDVTAAAYDASGWHTFTIYAKGAQA